MKITIPAKLQRLACPLVLAISILGLSHKAFALTQSEWEAQKSSSVKWEDIRGWVNLGIRFGGALNSSGEVIAVYDFSYPTFINRIKLGAWIPGKFDLEPVKEQLKLALEDPETENRDLGEKALAHVNRLISSGDSGTFSENWWKSLPWKSKKIANQSKPPQAFSLGDLDFEGAAKDRRKFRNLISQIEEVIDRAEMGSFSARGLLDQIKFEKEPTGESYEIAWYPKSTHVTRPFKVADLMNERAILHRSMAWAVTGTLLAAMMSLIPVEGLNAFLATAVDRFTHYHSLLQGSHEDMLLELLNVTDDGSSQYSPFLDLSEEQRKTATYSALMGGGALADGFQWIWKDPEEAWEKRKQKNDKLYSSSSAWLKKNGVEEKDLNARYGVGTKGEKKWLHLLARRTARGKFGPYVSVDYQSPNRNFAERLSMEILSVAVIMGSYFIQGGVLIKAAYTTLVEQKFNITRRWEARLIAYLEERQVWGQEDWIHELGILEHQRLNPFEMKRKDVLELIAQRKGLLGLQTP